MVAPKKVATSGSAPALMISIISESSCMVSFSLPQIFTKRFLAPSTLASSSKGLLSAFVAASTALFCPSPTPTPI